MFAWLRDNGSCVQDVVLGEDLSFTAISVWSPGVERPRLAVSYSTTEHLLFNLAFLLAYDVSLRRFLEDRCPLLTIVLEHLFFVVVELGLDFVTFQIYGRHVVLEELKLDKLVSRHVPNDVGGRNFQISIRLVILLDHLLKDLFLNFVQLQQGAGCVRIALRDVLLGENGHVVGPQLADPALLPHDPA